MDSRWSDGVRALGRDHLSPASVLAERAEALLTQVAGEAPDELADVACAVVCAQPAMAPLANVANVALRAQEALGAASVAPALVALRRGIDADRRAAAAALVARMDRPKRIVTTSASAAVATALEALRDADLLEEVVCGESRPLLEGTALARWLAEQGFDVTLACDAALGEHLDRDAAFVVGADAILPAGIVNKRGTRLLATWAALAGAERYVLATRDKIWPPELVPVFDNPARPPGEVVQKPPPGLRVDNRAFDTSARGIWTAVYVGGTLLHEAETSGDHALAVGLRKLVAPGA
jgi:translation initiation factor 2B subunit (eIF-2B alpha/beta/delta family)